MKKKFGAFGAGHFSLEILVGGRPGTTIFQNPGGGGSHTRIGPGRPPGAWRPWPGHAWEAKGSNTFGYLADRWPANGGGEAATSRSECWHFNRNDRRYDPPCSSANAVRSRPPREGCPKPRYIFCSHMAVWTMPITKTRLVYGNGAACARSRKGSFYGCTALQTTLTTRTPYKPSQELDNFANERTFERQQASRTEPAARGQPASPTPGKRKWTHGAEAVGQGTYLLGEPAHHVEGAEEAKN